MRGGGGNDVVRILGGGEERLVVGESPRVGVGERENGTS